MENQKLMQFVEKTVKNEIRKGKLVRSKDVLAQLPALVDPICIDKTQMRNSIEDCLSNHNPLNAVLKLFGVQIIQQEKAINSLLGSGSDEGEISISFDDLYSKQWLTLNPKEFQATVERIGQMLYELESQATEAYDEEKKRGDDLFTKYEKLVREYNELKYSVDANEKMIAERVQYLLSLHGKDAADNEQLVELLKDMDIEVYWDCSTAPFTDAAMFTEYVVEDAISVNGKPCLVRDGAVFAKGIRFLTKE